VQYNVGVALPFHAQSIYIIIANVKIINHGTLLANKTANNLVKKYKCYQGNVCPVRIPRAWAQRWSASAFHFFTPRIMFRLSF